MLPPSPLPPFRPFPIDPYPVPPQLPPSPQPPRPCLMVYCFARPCSVNSCPAYPEATCADDYCGGCKAIFTDVDTGRELTYDECQGKPAISTTTPSPITIRPRPVCTADMKECPDGSFVGRDSNNNCQFKPCPISISPSPPIPINPSSCPPDTPQWPRPRSKCSFTGECSYGEETCCGVTHASYKCHCISGITECFYTDACMASHIMGCHNDPQVPQPRCGTNEVWKECGSACPPTCQDPAFPFACLAVCVPECQCQDGYVRDKTSGDCVLKENCPIQIIRPLPGPIVFPQPQPIPLPFPTPIDPQQPIICTADAKRCPDGSYVVRDGNNGCEWEPCPVSAPIPVQPSGCELIRCAAGQHCCDNGRGGATCCPDNTLMPLPKPLPLPTIGPLPIITLPPACAVITCIYGTTCCSDGNGGARCCPINNPTDPIPLPPVTPPEPKPLPAGCMLIFCPRNTHCCDNGNGRASCCPNDIIPIPDCFGLIQHFPN